MRARILFLAAILSLYGCSKHATTESLPSPPQESTGHTGGDTVYLLRRVAVATEDTLCGFEEGTAAKVIEARADKLLVQIQDLQFEIKPADVTNDLAERDAARARAAKSQALRQRAEDRKFLAEEDARRSTTSKIAQLQSAIQSARAEIARLNLESFQAARRMEGQPISTTIDDTDFSMQASDDLAEENERQERIAALRSQIGSCTREIQILSDRVAGEN